MTNPYMRKNDVLALLHIGARTFERWIRKDGFPSHIQIGRIRLWKSSELELWLSKHKKIEKVTEQVTQ